MHLASSFKRDRVTAKEAEEEERKEENEDEQKKEEEKEENMKEKPQQEATLIVVPTNNQITVDRSSKRNPIDASRDGRHYYYHSIRARYNTYIL
ncbi:hypothetical protein HZH66_004324 [Vespula vulgaris]|uniref:Uncharacterized protein n=1 Tax=Vespula vulgaris TaxID=7454 RepID=A0A834KER9_VESVU|nr:hypothetical protein HZH66_004324 [Vespula vulgaris]